eukprot:7384732-Prymnesium_polylepis.2
MHLIRRIRCGRKPFHRQDQLGVQRENDSIRGRDGPCPALVHGVLERQAHPILRRCCRVRRRVVAAERTEISPVPSVSMHIAAGCYTTELHGDIRTRWQEAERAASPTMLP